MTIEPSRVIYVKNVSESSEPQLLEFLNQFGTVVNTAWLPNLDKVLIEFETLESAERLIAMCRSGTPVTIDGKVVTFAYSKSQKINTSANQKVYAPPGSQRILHCNIQDAYYNITVNVIKNIMEGFGNILRIVIFTKTTLQVLVEFETAESARMALKELDGKFIYPDCCKLKIEFSRQERLNVHYNNQKQWDFTKGPEEGVPTFPQSQFMAPPVDMQQWAQRTQFFPPFFSEMGMMPMPGMPTAAAPADGSSVMPAQLYQTPQLMGQMHPQGVVAPQAAPAQPKETSVLIIDNLPKHVTEKNLFNFASLYGVVVRAKRISMAYKMLLQMRNPNEAKNVADVLNTLTLLRVAVHAEPYRQSFIRDSSDGGYHVVDFSKDPFNRFKDGTVPVPPSKTIIFTVGCACEEADISVALNSVGAPEPSAITISRKSDTSEDKNKEAEKDSTETESEPSKEEGAAAAVPEVTTGTISCVNTDIAAEIVMMANNAPVRGNAHLELCFSS